MVHINKNDVLLSYILDKSIYFKLAKGINNKKDIGHKKSKTSLGSLFILIILVIFILFIESIIILISFLRKGVFKKKILTKKSSIGFDIDIYIKE